MDRVKKVVGPLVTTPAGGGSACKDARVLADRRPPPLTHCNPTIFLQLLAERNLLFGEA
jgi:hypothetical protein